MGCGQSHIGWMDGTQEQEGSGYRQTTAAAAAAVWDLPPPLFVLFTLQNALFRRRHRVGSSSAAAG